MIHYESDGQQDYQTGMGIVYDKRRKMHYQGEIKGGICVFDPD